MEYILYKKNIPILKFTENKGNIEVLQVYNKEHLPVALFLNGKASSYVYRTSTGFVLLS